MNLKIQLVNTNKEYEEILNIRKLVFVEEQNVPIDIEIEFEDESHHVICYNDDFPVATGRWRETSFGIKLERFAVLHEFRGMGIGKQIVNYILSQISGQILHAQTLEFSHPVKNNRLKFKAPHPNDFKKMLSLLNKLSS